MYYQILTYEISDSVVTISLNRPDVLNAINQQMMQELDNAFDQVSSDKDARILILKGEGRA